MTIQLDEMWSFVGNKENKQWVWLAIDTDSRELVGCSSVIVLGKVQRGFGNLYQRFTVSARSAESDFWEAYEQVLPSKRHRAVGKETGKTSYPIAIQQHFALLVWGDWFVKPCRSQKN